MMENSFSLLICGKIRDGQAFNQDLSIYEEWQRRGLIKSIVFSGWREDRNDGCIGRLEQMGARIVLTDAPDFRSVGNILHQMKTLHFALRDVPEDDLVIKSRTDKVWLNFDPSIALERLQTAAPVGPNCPFAKRLMVLGMLPLQPFFINDMMFFGRAADVRKLVSFNIWYEIEQAVLNAEQIFHYSPYMQPGDIFQDYYRLNPGLIHGNLNKARALQKLMLGNEVILRAIARYLVTFEQSYVISAEPSPPFVPPASATVLELLDLPPSNCDEAIRMDPGANTLVIRDEAAVSYLLDLPVSPSESRTLREISAAHPLSRYAVQTCSQTLKDEFAHSYPDQHPAPRVVETDGPCEILASRVRYLFPNQA